MLRRPHAAQGTREFVRGSMAAMPFAPGAQSPSSIHCTPCSAIGAAILMPSALAMKQELLIRTLCL